MKKLVVLSGAGISAESGIKTFRDSGGLWEGHDVMEVASIQGWINNPKNVLDFYNARRKNAHLAKPNPGHKAIADLEKHFKVTVITQNVDNLHEQAGSSYVLHLHGELTKARSTSDPSLIYELQSEELNLGDLCEKGSQLRPHIVWFGEMVPMMEYAIQETYEADIFLVVGTSLQVYPAAGLLEYVKNTTPKFIIDPNLPKVSPRNNTFLFEENASTGVPKVKDILINDYL